MLNLRRPSPAMVVALVALFVSLSGTAVAAGVPLAKRALFASNSGKLQGRTARQVAAMPGPATDLQGLLPQEIAAMPSPASTASSLVVSASAPFALAPNEGKDFSGVPRRREGDRGRLHKRERRAGMGHASDRRRQRLDALRRQRVDHAERDGDRLRGLPALSSKHDGRRRGAAPAGATAGAC
jgi:hypothetical protein